MTKRKGPGPEHYIQKAIIEYLDFALPGTVRAVGVGNNPRNMFTAQSERAKGLRKGFPDILLIGFDMGEPFSGLIEVKSEGGRLRPEQREWRDWCKEVGVPHAVCRSVDDAKETLEEWNLI